MDKSFIEFKQIDGKTVLTQQYSVKPLKIINPKSSPSCSFCMLTNYGGGFVQGDSIFLDVKCGENTNSIISSQANTRIYESTGIICNQTIDANLDKNAFHVFLNDPLVMHKGGSFSQKSTYKLAIGAVLLLVDWVVAGRTDNGEQYEFKEYFSDTSVFLNNQLLMRDKIHLSPDDMDIYSPALLGNNITFMNIYLIGNENLEKVEILENTLNQINEGIYANRKIKSTVDRINPNTYAGRFTSSEVIPLRKVIEKISNALYSDRLLQFDPLIRKY